MVETIITFLNSISLSIQDVEFRAADIANLVDPDGSLRFVRRVSQTLTDNRPSLGNTPIPSILYDSACVINLYHIPSIVSAQLNFQYLMAVVPEIMKAPVLFLAYSDTNSPIQVLLEPLNPI